MDSDERVSELVSSPFCWRFSTDLMIIDHGCNKYCSMKIRPMEAESLDID